MNRCKSEPCLPFTKQTVFRNIPSMIQLNILQFSGFCPKCYTYENHKIETCSQCDDFLCQKLGDIIWCIGDTNSIICRNCIIKQIDRFSSTAVDKLNTGSTQSVEGSTQSVEGYGGAVYYFTIRS